MMVFLPPCRATIAAAASLSALLLAVAPAAADEIVDFSSERWDLEEARVVTHLDRQCVRGTAYLKDVEFENGVIEVDIATDGSRSYPGVVFRQQAEGEYEHVYVRPHRAGLYPDALQYAPVFNGVGCWQLYHGRGFTAPAALPVDQWIHVKLEIHGTQARVYLNNADQPALVIPELKHGASRGAIGVAAPVNQAAYFSNFSYRTDDTLAFEPPETPETRAGTIREWKVSRSFPANRVARDSYPSFFAVFAAEWRPVVSEPSGLVCVSRHAPSGPSDPQAVFARTVVSSKAKQPVKLSFGYSDDVTVFLNGQPIFSGRSGYRRRDPSFLGAIGYFDAVHVTLEPGLNEICLLVTDSFGGWGFMCKADRELDPPIKEHGRVTKVWETPAEFKIPESVLYDPQREILYVSSFSRLGEGDANTGFISQLTLDGRIEELKWIDELDGPCGMGIYEDRLYVVECSGNLVEIDIDAGKIAKRVPVPGAEFLNDLAIDRTGTIYMSNSSRVPEATDVHRFRAGKCDVWKDGTDLHRANGLFVHDNSLIVGNTGDGFWKRVELDSGHVSPIACLGAGINDGIRVDSDGNYLLSHWEGQLYRVSPSGEVVELLDTMAAGLNCADFEFVRDRGLLVIPTFLGNNVVAYKLASP